eukprot:TRINITY_DN7262_c0_g1_i1.p1 TRINITY_DN7262_c0_g1~~TRINITY_DN7262_c0_g1_i1.p1  ORF type:complete len:154 (-),score=28.54 TRINITY_DN7262_c0_g1_i1:307-768(-)
MRRSGTVNLSWRIVQDSEVLRVLEDPNVEFLRLQKCRLVDISMLVQALETNYTLRGISLRGNRIDNTGAALIGALLLLNTTLQTINLSGNNISDASPFVEALRVNSSLTHLNLNSNPLNSVSVVALTQTMQLNYTLKFLSLSTKLHYLDSNIP